MKIKKISVIGLGYIGLPTAALLASKNVNVLGVDINQDVIKNVNNGKVHIIEPNLDQVVNNVVKKGYLRASLTLEKADAFIIAVPTPFKENFSPDLSYVKNSAEKIAPVLEKGNIVILESTSPVGTTEKFCTWLSKIRPDLKFPDKHGELADVSVAYCPERVLPGYVLDELVNNDRILGGVSHACAKKASFVYNIFLQGKCFFTDAKTAELAKLAENSFRDVNIAFANELSIIAEKFDINVWNLIELVNRHPRVNVLKPGPGVGGHCIAVDPWFIVDFAKEDAKIIKLAREVNNGKIEYVVNKINKKAEEFFNNNSAKENISIACLGLSYKPDIGDLRESPSVEVVKSLANNKKMNILAVEPNVEVLPKCFSEEKNISLENLSCAVNKADVIVILVAHSEFTKFNFCELKNIEIIDTVGILQKKSICDDVVATEKNGIKFCKCENEVVV